MFVGQRVRWCKDKHGRDYIGVNQNLAIDELEEIPLQRGEDSDKPCTPTMHTAYRSVLGQINWVQPRTQAQICYKFSRAASAAANPAVGNVRELNKLVRTIRADPLELRYWPLKGPDRRLGYPDASYRNNEDKSSQRAHVIFLAEERKANDQSGKLQREARSSKKFTQRENTPNAATAARGSLIDYESHKITTITMSTTVAELQALMHCYGSCLFLKGLLADMTGREIPIHIRTDANNLVTTAGTTHLPEQKETHHLIQMMRKESQSGSLQDLAHISSKYCLADALTKSSAPADEFVKAVETGDLPDVDIHPPFREMLQHKAFLTTWSIRTLKNPGTLVTVLGTNISAEIYSHFYCRVSASLQ